MSDREILFRGKRKDNGEWIEGYYINIAYVNPFIATGKIHLTAATKGSFSPEMYKVIPKTVGQYTGLTDKNGTKIFEGDIVYVYGHPDEVGDDDFAVIRYDNDDAMFIIEFDTFCLNFGNCWGTDVEVIGNVYDNPELLKDE